MKKRIGNRGKKFWLIILSSFQICVYMLGIILVFWFSSKIGSSIGEGSWPPKIDVLALWAQIVIAYAAVFAVGQYAVAYLDIDDKKTDNVLKLIRFFRESILASSEDLMRRLRKDGMQLPIILLRKNTPHLKFTEQEYFTKIYPNQKSELEKYIEVVKKDPEIDVVVRANLNSAEEFAIGILNSNSQQHVAVSSIKKPFVQLIDEIAVPLYYYIGLHNDGFPYISQLYQYWKKDVGFIPRTEDDKREVLKERESKYKEHK
jgi:hypothetical protein